jgi:outer membrane protein, heavy metal efflux system
MHVVNHLLEKLQRCARAMTRCRFFFVSFLLLGFGSISPAQQPVPTPNGDERLTIEQAVAEAVDKNLDLIAERFNLPISEARLITARLRPNPVFTLGGDHLDLLGTGYNQQNGAGPPEYSLRTDFLFERGGKRQRRIDVAQAGKRVAELQLQNTIRGVVLDVQTAFVDVLRAKAELALAREIFSTFDEIVRINASRVKSGDLAEVELIRSQVAQLQFENTVRQAELQLQTARAQLQLLLGRRKGDRRVDAVGDMRREPVSLRLENLRAQAFTQRPDLLAQQQESARTQAELRLQLAQGKVDYSLGTEYRRQDGLAGRGNSLGLFFQTNIPLFNHNQGEIERARQEQLQAEARIRALEATIENELEVAYLRYRNSLNTLNRIEESLLTRASDVRQISHFSYRRGEATFLEFLDAQRAYTETMQAYNGARAEFARSLYGIDAATGTISSRTISSGGKP